MTVWLGGVAPGGRALSDEFVQRVCSDLVELTLDVDEQGKLLVVSRALVNFKVKRTCRIFSIGVYPSRHSMELVYAPSEFTSGMKFCVGGDSLSVTLVYSMMSDRPARREDISSLKAMEG